MSMFGYLAADNGNSLSLNAPANDLIDIEVTVDSGACDSVMPIGWCKGIQIRPNALSAIGFEYAVANGDTIPTAWERRCMMMTEGSRIQTNKVVQWANVHKPLLSLSRCADMGFECRLGTHGGVLMGTQTGEQIPLHRRGHLYHMKASVRNDTSQERPDRFARQG